MIEVTTHEVARQTTARVIRSHEFNGQRIVDEWTRVIQFKCMLPECSFLSEDLSRVAQHVVANQFMVTRFGPP